MRVEDALNTLAFTKKGIAPDGAQAGAFRIAERHLCQRRKGPDVDVDRLFVKNAISNEGPRMKRIRPAPMGRAFRYQRRMTHIAVALAEKNAAARKHRCGDRGRRRAEPAKLRQEADQGQDCRKAGEKEISSKEVSKD